MYHCICCQTLLPENAEDGFCSFDCENAWYDRAHDPSMGEDADQFEAEDFMSQWDDDPSPYDGTYSEE